MTEKGLAHKPYSEENAVTTRALARVFGNFRAVDGVDLTIRRGEMYGFLGPNGAGKTTTLRIILGLLKPSKGEARLFGELVTPDSLALKRRVGVAFEQQSFYDEMTALEYLLFFGRIYQVDNAATRAAELLERLHLWHVRDLLIAGFSTGMQRKLSFARALLHSPDLLVLDEPVSGLDPFGIRQLREILLEERAAGRTILISSHILSEIEQTADRVGILARGKLIAEATTDALRRKVSPVRRIDIEIDRPAAEIAPRLQSLPFVRSVTAENTQIHLETGIETGVDERVAISRTLMDAGALILAMHAIEPSLEEAFIQLTESVIDRLAIVPNAGSPDAHAPKAEVAA